MTSPKGGPLRVLVLATTFPATPGDGTPEFVLTLSKELGRRGAQVTVLVPRVPGAAAHETIGGVTVRRFRYFPARWEDLADGAIVPRLKARPSRWAQVVPLVVCLWWSARREVRRTGAGVVHAHWVIPAGLVARLLGRPYVVTAHGADAYALSGGVFDLIKRIALARAAAVVPVSSAIGARLAGLGATPQPAVPMGVDIAGIGSAVGDREEVAGRVLFVGRLVDKKGVDDLVKALARIPGATVRLVGDGPSRARLESLVESLGLGERILFLGQQPRQVVLEEMAKAAVVALPSKVGEGGDEDGVPVVLAEAMAAGVPIVACDAGGLGEHVVNGETGWLVTSDSVNELARALGEALADPVEAHRRAKLARERMVDTLGIDRVGESYLRLLSEAARS